MKYTKQQLRNGSMPLLRRVERMETKEMDTKNKMKEQNGNSVFKVLGHSIRTNIESEKDNFFDSDEKHFTRLGLYNKRRGKR